MNEEKKERVSAETLAGFCARIADEKKAENVVTIPIAGKSSLADYLVIATATSMPHLTALASHVERSVRETYRLRIHASDGNSESGWVVLDFVTVIVHLLLPELRTRYGLESLWSGEPTPQAISELEAHIRRRK